MHKGAKLEVFHSLAFGTKDKNTFNYTSIPPYVYIRRGGRKG
jgi:hypothetical protein